MPESNGAKRTAIIVGIILAIIGYAVGDTLFVVNRIDEKVLENDSSDCGKFFPKDSGLVLENKVENISADIDEIKDNVQQIATNQQNIMINIAKIAEKLNVDTVNP